MLCFQKAFTSGPLKVRTILYDVNHNQSPQCPYMANSPEKRRKSGGIYLMECI